MTEYKCGCKTSGMIIIEEGILSLSAYLVWAESVGVFGTREICWECWNKDRFKLTKNGKTLSKKDETKR